MVNTKQMALEALKQSHQAFEFIAGCNGMAVLDPITLREGLDWTSRAIAALEAELAQVVEPVGELIIGDDGAFDFGFTDEYIFGKSHLQKGTHLLYTAPQEPVNAEMLEAVNALLHQIDIGDFIDSHGHSAKMLKPVHDLLKLLGVNHE